MYYNCGVNRDKGAEQSIRDLKWSLARLVEKQRVTHFDYSEERHMTTKEEVVLSAHSHLWIYGRICTTDARIWVPTSAHKQDEFG